MVLPVDDGSLRIAALDYQVGDLSDPAELAKYTRADILIVHPDQFWGRPEFEGRMAAGQFWAMLDAGKLR